MSDHATLKDILSWNPCWINDMPKEGLKKIKKLIGRKKKLDLKFFQGLYGKISRKDWVWVMIEFLSHSNRYNEVWSWCFSRFSVGTNSYYHPYNYMVQNETILRRAIRFLKGLK